jgi:hypothetical protein
MFRTGMMMATVLLTLIKIGALSLLELMKNPLRIPNNALVYISILIPTQNVFVSWS